MATYTQTIKVSQKMAAHIAKCLSEHILTEDETIIHSAHFQDGHIAVDIKCCGTDDEPAWTEAVLFEKDSDGAYYECACTEVSDEYMGEWILEHDGDTYIVNVEEN